MPLVILITLFSFLFQPLIRANYEDIKFLPDQYIPYLLSSEIGFATSEVMGVPQHKAQGEKLFKFNTYLKN